MGYTMRCCLKKATKKKEKRERGWRMGRREKGEEEEGERKASKHSTLTNTPIDLFFYWAVRTRI